MKTVSKTNQLALCTLTACLIAVSTAAYAQASYPTKPIRIIVPAAAGGGADITARMIAPRLSEYLGQQVVVENQGGGGTVIGMERVARAAPDGYTLAICLSSLTITPYVMPKLPYNPAKDFAPISQVLRVPSILVSHPSLPAQSLKELIAFVKANPAKLSYASPGFGGNQHLGMELFLLATGLKMGPAHYKGMAPAIADVVAGHVPMIIGDILGVMPHIKAGRLRAYGVTSLKRADVAPDIPSIAEAGKGGWVRRAVTSAASTRPRPCASATCSAPKGLTRASRRFCASSTEIMPGLVFGWSLAICFSLLRKTPRALRIGPRLCYAGFLCFARRPRPCAACATPLQNFRIFRRICAPGGFRKSSCRGRPP